METVSVGICSDGKKLTLVFPDTVKTENAPRVEEEVLSALSSHSPEKVTIDASRLQYISSAGLRIILRLLKRYPHLSVIEVSPEVYEILDVTGFTSMMAVKRRLQRISTEGCPVIGSGKNGCVYRLSPDTIVKVHYKKNTPDDIVREQQMARFGFISGIPTAIPFSIVRAGEHLGTVYELLDAASLSQEIREHPENMVFLIQRYICLLKILHSAVPDMRELPKDLSLPDRKAEIISWAECTADILGSEDTDRLKSILSEQIAPSNTLLHGDPHPGNVMDVAGEMNLIDMDGLGIGDPLLDLAAIMSTVIGFPALMHDDFIGWHDPEINVRFWQTLFDGYYTGLSPNEKEQKLRVIRLCMHTRLTRYSLRHPEVSEEDRKKEADCLRSLLR